MESAYSSPSSNPWLEAGAPPNIEGTPAGGAAGFGAAFGFEAAFLRPADAGRFLADLAGALCPFAFFLAVLPADFFVVLVFFLPPFFLAAMRDLL